MEPHYYNVELRWDSDRKGILSSPELQSVNANTDVEVATPPQFPGGMEGIWSPEHLFTAAVSSCLMTTFLAIAENSKLPYKHFSCSAKGKLEKIEGKFQMSEVLLFPSVVVSQEEDVEKAERILQKAEAACLISNSIRATVHMQTKITVG